MVTISPRAIVLAPAAITPRSGIHFERAPRR